MNVELSSDFFCGVGLKVPFSGPLGSGSLGLLSSGLLLHSSVGTSVLSGCCCVYVCVAHLTMLSIVHNIERGIIGRLRSGRDLMDSRFSRSE
jgi:hypothetical protein